MVALLLTLSIIVFVAIELFVARGAQRTAEPDVLTMREPSPPESIFLSPHHTWVRLTTEGAIQLGIDDLLAQLLGPIESVWTAPPGAHLRPGDPVLRLRITGREVTVPSPTGGVIVHVNHRVLSAPWVLSHDAYESGWVVVMRPDDYHATVSGRRIGKEARKWLSEEFRRAVDFLAGSSQVVGRPILADGAVPNRGAVATLDAERFEEFKRSFVEEAA